jgi:hypothetical protein
VNLAEGIDHALSCDASKRPRKDHHIESRIWMRELLRGTGGKAHVSNTGCARIPFRGSNGLHVWINPVNPCSELRDAECEASITAPEVQNALPAHQLRAAPLPELVVRTRPQSRRQGGDVPAHIADRVRCDTAHGYVQTKPGREREI